MDTRAELYTDGSITDGDDHGWSGNPATLEGGGGWSNFDFSNASLLGKRDRASSSESNDLHEEEEVRQQFFPSFDPHNSDDEEEVNFSFLSKLSDTITFTARKPSPVFIKARRRFRESSSNFQSSGRCFWKWHLDGQCREPEYWQ